MKASIIALATVFALSGTVAMAQTSGTSSGATPTTKAEPSMNSAPAKETVGSSTNRTPAMNSNDQGSSSRVNGHGINDEGVTTNQGRKYNGG